ncbi:hypothetical protein EPN52_00900 [bacterium]|nr:MAG: hypothetical protein EPN52_00900 [bacterium]
MLTTGKQVIVGYDRPLDYYFAQVVGGFGDVASLDGMSGYIDLDHLVKGIAPYAAMTDAALGRLARDRRERIGNAVGVLNDDGTVK